MSQFHSVHLLNSSMHTMSSTRDSVLSSFQQWKYRTMKMREIEKTLSTFFETLSVVHQREPFRYLKRTLFEERMDEKNIKRELLIEVINRIVNHRKELLQSAFSHWSMNRTVMNSLNLIPSTFFKLLFSSSTSFHQSTTPLMIGDLKNIQERSYSFIQWMELVGDQFSMISSFSDLVRKIIHLSFPFQEFFERDFQPSSQLFLIDTKKSGKVSNKKKRRQRRSRVNSLSSLSPIMSHEGIPEEEDEEEVGEMFETKINNNEEKSQYETEDDRSHLMFWTIDKETNSHVYCNKFSQGGYKKQQESSILECYENEEVWISPDFRTILIPIVLDYSQVSNHLKQELKHKVNRLDHHLSPPTIIRNELYEQEEEETGDDESIPERLEESSLLSTSMHLFHLSQLMGYQRQVVGVLKLHFPFLSSLSPQIIHSIIHLVSLTVVSQVIQKMSFILSLQQTSNEENERSVALQLTHTPSQLADEFVKIEEENIDLREKLTETITSFNQLHTCYEKNTSRWKNSQNMINILKNEITVYRSEIEEQRQDREYLDSILSFMEDVGNVL